MIKSNSSSYCIAVAPLEGGLNTEGPMGVFLNILICARARAFWNFGRAFHWKPLRLEPSGHYNFWSASKVEGNEPLCNRFHRGQKLVGTSPKISWPRSPTTSRRFRGYVYLLGTLNRSRDISGKPKRTISHVVLFRLYLAPILTSSGGRHISRKVLKRRVT